MYTNVKHTILYICKDFHFQIHKKKNNVIIILCGYTLYFFTIPYKYIDEI